MRPSRLVLLGVLSVLVCALAPVAWFACRLFVLDWYRVPTNAMAPAIWGRHKDVTCPQCGYEFRVAASDEVAASGAPRGSDFMLTSAVCPMCRYVLGAGPGGPAALPPSQRGESIFASKLAYTTAEPQRWDVAVFRYPGDPHTNYVKRIVGLPGETVRIAHGDVLIRAPGQKEFRVARKPPELARKMLHLVYDSEYALAAMVDKGLPARWTAWPAGGEDGPGRWRCAADGKTFSTDGAGEAWLRYEHRVPSFEDWKRLESDAALDAPPGAQLVTDFFAGNTGRDCAAVVRDPAPGVEALGLHWVGDLALECSLQIEGDSGQVVLELIEGGVPLACRIDAATGEAALSIGSDARFSPKADTAVRGPGTHEVLFANVDDQLLLWVDGQPVAFDAPTTYDSKGNARPEEPDLAPAGIASRGVKVTASRLRLCRDTYYIAVRGMDGFFAGGLLEWGRDGALARPLDPRRLADLLSDPAQWDVLQRPTPCEFVLGPGQFLALGDNSARSKDSRLWEQDGVQYWVDREALIGKVTGD